MRNAQDAQLLVIVARHGKNLTLNLKAPIVINVEARTGRQVVASGDLPMNYELIHERPPLKKSA